MASEIKRHPKAPNPIPVIHPALIALYPVLGLYANNADMTPFSSAWRAMVLLPLLAMVVWLVLSILLRQMHKAGILVSAVLLALFSGWRVLEFLVVSTLPYVSAIPTAVAYGLFLLAVVLTGAWIVLWNRGNKKRGAAWCVVLVLAAAAVPVLAEGVLYGTVNRGVAWYTATYLSLVALLIVWIVRYRGDLRPVTMTANWFGLILVGLYLLLFLYNRPGADPASVPRLEALEAKAATYEAQDDSPDIYLIILHGYSRSDELRRQFGFNNIPFEESLREQGFVVADRSLSNYSTTDAAMQACLNMDYLQDLHAQLEETQAVLPAPYDDNRVYRFLHQLGYRTVLFSPGLDAPATRSGIDTVLRPPRTFNEFEMVLLDSTLLSRFMQAYYGYRYRNPGYWRYESRRTRTLFAFDAMPELATESAERPQFVLAHLFVPSPPFLFRRDGTRASPFGPVALGGDETYRGTERTFVEQYLDQLHYTNQQLKGLVTAIIEKAERPVTIVVASDQGLGPQSKASLQGSSEGRYANLLAMRLPAGHETRIPSGASLVNLFRFLFNDLFSTALPLLENKAYRVVDGEQGEYDLVIPAG